MENQRKTVVGTSSPAPTPTPAPPKTAQMLHNFELPADLKWCTNTSSVKFSRGRRLGESSSSSVSPQKQRSAASVFSTPQQSGVLKSMFGQGPSGSGSSSRNPFPNMISDKESGVINVLSSGFMLDRDKGENEEGESVKKERFSMTLPSPEKMVDQFKKGLILSDKQGRDEKKVIKKLSIHKKSETVKAEKEPVRRIYEDKSLVKDDLEVPYTKGVQPLAVEDEKKLSIIDDKALPMGFVSKYDEGEDEDVKNMTEKFGESERVPWNLRPRKPNQRPKVPKPSEAVGSSCKLGGKSVEQKKSKMPEAIGNDSSNLKKGKEKKGKEKKEKGKEKSREKGNNMPIVPNFNLTLTPEEIAEDLFAMTGQKPSRKFKKRDKSVQENLDQLFPGMHLKDITLNDYKTSDNPKKGD